MEIKPQLAKLIERIDEMSVRERGILFVLIAAGLFFLFDALLLQPEQKVQKQLLSNITQLRQEMATMGQQSLQIIAEHSNDPNARELAQLKQLNTTEGKIEEQIVAALAGLIEPGEMAAALEKVLKGQNDLRFVRLENLGARPVLAEEEGSASQQPMAGVANAAGEVAAAASPDLGIYKHTMRLELEGSFHATRTYLQALEKLPWKFHWESVELEMLDYPMARVVITVSTLSMSEGWIGV